MLTACALSGGCFASNPDNQYFPERADTEENGVYRAERNAGRRGGSRSGRSRWSRRHESFASSGARLWNSGVLAHRIRQRHSKVREVYREEQRPGRCGAAAGSGGIRISLRRTVCAPGEPDVGGQSTIDSTGRKRSLALSHHRHSSHERHASGIPGKDSRKSASRRRCTAGRGAFVRGESGRDAAKIDKACALLSSSLRSCFRSVQHSPARYESSASRLWSDWGMRSPIAMQSRRVPQRSYWKLSRPLALSRRVAGSRNCAKMATSSILSLKHHPVSASVTPLRFTARPSRKFRIAGDNLFRPMSRCVSKHSKPEREPYEENCTTSIITSRC